jgi:DnaK suppressor protein
VSKTPAKSDTPAAKTPAAKKSAATKAATASSAPASAATRPASSKPSAKAPTKHAARAAAPSEHGVDEPELATETTTPAGGDTIHRFTDRFAPAKPAARMHAESFTEHPKPTVKADPKVANAWKSKSGRELTEPELLAMPDSEYMNDKQLDFFRARLQALKDDLLSNAGETTEHLREDTSIVPDPADRATIEEEHALELRTRDRERKLLKKIAQSLARIDAGDYGYCDETGEPIGLGRLLARPTATLSLEAQQRREMKQKMFGD